ncbi:MAG: hypothetical protein QW076_02920 [Candidatus Anstonellales archaeon]
MSEITKDFIKFVVEIIILIMVLAVVFSPEGIASQTFYYLIFSEPILLENYISTTLSVADQTPGEFSSTIKTLGEPYNIKIYKEDEVFYVLVHAVTRPYQRAIYTGIKPVPIIRSNCVLKEKIIALNRTVGQAIKIKKVFDENGDCELKVFV